MADDPVKPASLEPIDDGEFLELAQEIREQHHSSQARQELEDELTAKRDAAQQDSATSALDRVLDSLAEDGESEERPGNRQTTVTVTSASGKTKNLGTLKEAARKIKKAASRAVATH